MIRRALVQQFKFSTLSSNKSVVIVEIKTTCNLLFKLIFKGKILLAYSIFIEII